MDRVVNVETNLINSNNIFFENMTLFFTSTMMLVTIFKSAEEIS
jgi:hypothetical protein